VLVIQVGTHHRYAATLNRSRHFTPAWAELLQTPAGHMHALLVERADALMGCPEGSPEEAELATLTDAIEARPLRVLGNEQGKVYAHTEHPPRSRRTCRRFVRRPSQTTAEPQR